MIAPIETTTHDLITPTTMIVMPKATMTGRYYGSGRWISSVGGGSAPSGCSTSVVIA
jgi:hypothetical protein